MHRLCTYVFIIVSIGLLLMVCSAKGAEDKPFPVRFTAMPVQNAFQLGEPIRIQLTFENRGSEALSIDLGTSDVDRLQITWKATEGEDKQIRRQGHTESGLAPRFMIVVPAEGVATHVFLLDKLIVPKQSGIFSLGIGIRGTELPEVNTTVRIQSPLKDRLKEWYSLAINPAASAKERVRAVEDIIYTRVPEAIPYQDALLEKHYLDPGQVDVCLRSMLDGTEDEAVRKFIGYLKENDGKSLRSAVLFTLKDYGWDRLNSANAKLLDSYKQEILRAVPVKVSD